MKKLCPQYTLIFKGFSFEDHLSKIVLECLLLAHKLGFDDVQEEVELLESHTEEYLGELDEHHHQEEKEALMEEIWMKELTVRNLIENSLTIWKLHLESLGLVTLIVSELTYADTRGWQKQWLTRLCCRSGSPHGRRASSSSNPEAPL